MEGVQKTLKKKTDRKKTLKSEEKEKQRIWGKSNNKNKIFGFIFIKYYLLYKKLYFAWKHGLKKSSLYHQILFTVFMCSRIFETQQGYTKTQYT